MTSTHHFARLRFTLPLTTALFLLVSASAGCNSSLRTGLKHEDASASPTVDGNGIGGSLNTGGVPLGEGGGAGMAGTFGAGGAAGGASGAAGATGIIVVGGFYGISGICYSTAVGCKGPPPEACGDGIVNQGGLEECDDGNVLPGDGCNGQCKIEPNWTCPKPGPCIRKVICGDGTIGPGEVCDDGNTRDGDGCNATCTVQDPGYRCVAGACTRVSQCGNKRIEPGEDCDDGNTSSGDGCSDSCKIEGGFVCPMPGAPCKPAPRCGDGIVQSSIGEACDDGNRVSGDGCSSDCKTKGAGCTCEPGRLCICTVAQCGDGKVEGAEGCDDGNMQSGDGCSSTCTIERGYLCPFPSAPCVPSCGDGIVLTPMEQCDPAAAGTNMAQACSATCRYNDGWVCTGSPPNCRRTACGDGTVEGNESCDDGNTMPGDGCSSTCRLEPSCNASAGQCASKCGDGLLVGEACDDGNISSGDGCSATCTVEPGFHCTQSSADAGFASTCSAICGDGVISPGEQCDSGTAKNLGGYGHCTADCRLGPYCGDGKVTDGEECDNGKNNDDYGAASACGPGCKLPPRCGDGIVQTGYDEACDDGPKNSTSTDPSVAYGACMANCKRGGRCGDGIKNGAEGCDDGANDGSYGMCNPDCTISPWCGDGIVQSDYGEECEPAMSNDPTCNSACRKIGGGCGDGIIQPPEQCDDGAVFNDGHYGGCAPSCTLAPHCGDGVLNGPEECDDGILDGSYGGCTRQCKVATNCGDGIVEGSEECDDGLDNGKDGVCSTSCTKCMCLQDGIRNDVIAVASCSPDDGPAVSIHFGVDRPSCDGIFSGPYTIATVWYTTWDELKPGTYVLDKNGGKGMSLFAPSATSSNYAVGTNTVLTINSIDAGWMTGHFMSSFSDGTMWGTMSVDFIAPWCAGHPMCG